MSGSNHTAVLDQLTAGETVAAPPGRRTINYVVASVTVYRKKALAKQAARLFDQTVPGRLVLVTCEDWDGTAYRRPAVTGHLSVTPRITRRM